MKRLDLSGHRKGRLVVLGYSHSHVQPSGQKRAVWRVKCDCGTEKLISTANLTHGNTVSCGCKLKEGNHRKPVGEASFNAVYRSYVDRAKNHRKNLVFSLTKDEFRTLTDAPCHYCGAVNSCASMARPTSNGAYIRNGIDRINSSLGYVLPNCVSCCKTCNIMKRDLPYDVFLAQIRRIYARAVSQKL
jgi:hypothetical protein